MKVGTDAVLLGAWCNVTERRKALDIGTGTGILSLMIAQRNELLKVKAIDIDGSSILQARDNIDKSEFRDRIYLDEMDFTTMESQDRFDLVICNPPFYEEQTLCPDNNRNNARHTSSLSFDVLIKNVDKHLTNDGIFSVIIPTSVSEKFIELCSGNNLQLYRRTDVFTAPRKIAKRTLLEFGRDAKTAYSSSSLCIRNANAEYSDEYINLTKDFYLNM